MKAKDLIKILEKYPDHEVDISVDISVDVSTCGFDFEKRAFSEEECDYQIVNKTITLMFEGYVNY